MALSVGGNSGSSNTSGQTQLDPEIKNRWLQLEGRADDAFRGLEQGYKTGGSYLDPTNMVAPLSDLQQRAIGTAQAIAGADIGKGALNSAFDRISNLPTARSMAGDPRLTQASAYRPAYEIQESLAGSAPYVPAYEIQESLAGPSVRVTGAQTGLDQLPQLSAGTAAQGAAAYKDLYDANVVNPALQDLFRGKQMTDTQNAGLATQAGAFGGSRHGVVDAETNRAFADAAAKEAGSLRQSGFATIAGLAQSDADRALSADSTRYGTAANVLQGNTANEQQARLTNAANANTMAQFDATQSQNADIFNANNENAAAQLMANLGVDLSKFNANQSQNADVFNATNENTAAWGMADSQDRASQSNADRILQALTSGGQLQLAGGQALGQLGQQQRDFALSDYNLLRDAGATLQANDQALRDATRQEALRRQELPLQALNAYLPAFGQNIPTMNSGGSSRDTVNTRGKQAGASWDPSKAVQAMMGA